MRLVKRCICLAGIVLICHSSIAVSDQRRNRAIHPSKPAVASINLCVDQLVLLLADESQVVAVSPLSQDPAGSFYHEKARRYPTLPASGEAILALAPEIVLTGPYTSRYTLSLLEKLGIEVVHVPLARSIADLVANLKLIGDVLNQTERAGEVIQGIESGIAEIRERVNRQNRTYGVQDAVLPSAAVYDPNGYTAGPETLRGQLLTLAGWRNVAEVAQLTGYGQLGLESMVRLTPQVVIESPYSDNTYSRGQAMAQHPAIRAAGLKPVMVRIESRKIICSGPWLLQVLDTLVTAREGVLDQRGRVVP